MNDNKEIINQLGNIWRDGTFMRKNSNLMTKRIDEINNKTSLFSEEMKEVKNEMNKLNDKISNIETVLCKFIDMIKVCDNCGNFVGKLYYYDDESEDEDGEKTIGVCLECCDKHNIKY